MSDPKSNLAEKLTELTDLANQVGAEGVWLVRGATNARLVYDADEIKPEKRISANVSINLALANAGVLVIIRFPSDGGEPGIEAR